MSVGNAPVEIDLDTTPMTLIVGKNGHGKTTFGEALCYGLFGRSWRGIKKPTLVNTINKRDLLVEVEFAAQGHNYLIRRGMRPSILEVQRDGELVNQSASIKDYQAYIEEHVLHLNFASFTQVVMLGTRGFVPFMELSAAARREIIEDLLDLRVFSSMNTLLKDRQAKNCDELNEVELAFRAVEERIRLNREHAARLLEQSTKQQLYLETQSTSIEQKIAKLESKKQKLVALLETAKGKAAEYSAVRAADREQQASSGRHRPGN